MKTRKRILIAVMAFATTFAFAQKKEIKKAERAIKSEKYSEGLSSLNEAEGLIAGADNATKIQFYKLKAQALIATAGTNYNKMKDAADALGQAIALDPKVKESAEEILFDIRSGLINEAVRDQNAGRNEAAADKLLTSFNMAKDPSDLYFAAGNYVNAGKYDRALEYYQTLLDMGYTGQVTEYVATNKLTGEVQAFSDENTRNIAVRAGDFIKPETRQTESRKGEILRNMTLIYIQLGQNDKALSLMSTARAENPSDVYLMRAEADMNYNMGNIARYNELMNQIVASSPDDPELYFNLGVGSAELGEVDKALGYYKKAIKLRPEYEAAYINMAVLKLAAEGPLVEEMNNLGNSAADNRRYDELKIQREEIFRSTIPVLTEAYKLNPNNKDVIRTLMNIYGQLAEDAKFQEMKTKLDALEAAGK